MAHAKISISLFVLLFTPTLAFAQITFPDTLFVKASVEQVKRSYTESLKNYSQLYNGKEYIEFKKNMPTVGSPFFGSDDWNEGMVFYDGDLYEMVSMRYDLLHEKLVVEHKGHGEIELISEKIKYFQIAGHTFVRLSEGVQDKALINSGFYDLIYDSTTKIFVKRLKVAEERVETENSMKLTFKEKDNILILKNGEFFPVGNKSSALAVFKDQKKALKKFISHNRIRYRTNRERALIQIAGQYDQPTL